MKALSSVSKVVLTAAVMASMLVACKKDDAARGTDAATTPGTSSGTSGTSGTSAPINIVWCSK